MRLYSRHFGEGKPVLILHGLFGSSDNWLSFGKALALHGYNVHLLDLRNHGQSPQDHTFEYASLSYDVAQYIESSGIVNPVVAGHSLGGKTTIKLATTAPHLLSAMVIIDIAPRFYPVHHKQIIDALESVDFTLMKTRSDVEGILSKSITEPAVLQFMLKNVWWKEKDRLAWRFNLEAISQNIIHVGEAVYPDGFFHLPSLFIRGGKSGYITDADESDILERFSGSEIKIAPGAGHWVHADNPEWLMQTLLEFLGELD
jgi:pimeloyl-ACP methyl ester carboxylesterase